MKDASPRKKVAKEAKGERLQVVLARFGLASRRGVVSLIESGAVQVNGQVVLEKGFRVDASKDKVSVNGKELEIAVDTEKRYFIFYKPKGVMTTMQDPNAERVVADFFKDISARLFPVGRLDRDTTGLLLMTNDGELAFRLTHPKFGVLKKYRATMEGFLTDDEIAMIEKGIRLEEGPTAPCKVQLERRVPRETTLVIVLGEGKKRQIRRIFEKVGHYVTDLERISYGPLSLGELRMGQKRELNFRELQSLRKAAGLRAEKAEKKGDV